MAEIQAKRIPHLYDANGRDIDVYGMAHTANLRADWAEIERLLRASMGGGNMARHWRDAKT